MLDSPVFSGYTIIKKWEKTLCIYCSKKYRFYVNRFFYARSAGKALQDKANSNAVLRSFNKLCYTLSYLKQLVK